MTGNMGPERESIYNYVEGFTADVHCKCIVGSLHSI